MSESCLLGPAFGDLAGHLERVGVDDGAPAREILDAVDGLRRTVAPDERILFLLGYDACAAMDARAHTHPHDPSLGPATLIRRLRPGPPAEVPTTPAARPALTLSSTSAARQAHLARIGRCREALHDGVIYQANLAHRLTVAPATRAEGLAFYLSRRGGAACAAYLDVAGWGSLISLSPERFVAADLAAGTASTWPIKGTVPRGSDADDDDAQVGRLRASEKDRAEHLMIVDLLRNDLGRVARVGGVTVESLMHVVSTPNVHHLESTISASLRADVGVADLMTALAPGGSITGAPKSSAIDVIAALEDGPRGAYTGVLGVVDGHGRLMTSLLIRTWLRPDDGPGALHVGGGIVVDSDPEAEWQETLHKAAAFGQVRVA